MLHSTPTAPARFDWPTALGLLVTRIHTPPEKRCPCCGVVVDADLEFRVVGLGAFCDASCAAEYMEN